jgi:hypothetical protein
MGENWGAYLGWTGAQIVQCLRGHCTGYVRNLGDDFVEAFLERFSPTAAKIGAQFRVKRALYRRKHGPFFLVGEDANAIYDYVAIALAMSGTLAMILSKRFSSVSRPFLRRFFFRISPPRNFRTLKKKYDKNTSVSHTLSVIRV